LQLTGSYYDGVHPLLLGERSAVIKNIQSAVIPRATADARISVRTVSPGGQAEAGRRGSRVPRWYTFKPKIPLWVYFRGPSNIKGRYILWSSGIFYFHLVQFTAIWYFFSVNLVHLTPVLVYCAKKNLATLRGRTVGQKSC
jgi:hypothetical protein